MDKICNYYVRREKQMSKVYKKRLIRPLLKAQDKMNTQNKSDSTTTSPSSPERLCQKIDSVCTVCINIIMFSELKVLYYCIYFLIAVN